MTAFLDELEATRMPERQAAEERARTEYARWFVKKHFLDKQQPRSFKGLPAYVHWYRQAQEAGSFEWNPTTAPYGPVPVPQRDRFGCVCTPSRRERISQNYRFLVGDLELDFDDEKVLGWRDEDWYPHFVSARGHYQSAQSYTEAYQQALADNLALEWLQTEAEYQVVYHEALVRSYGADVTAP